MKTVQQKLVGFMSTLEPAELDELSEQTVLRIRKIVRKHNGELAAYRVELSESERIIEDTTKRIAQEEKRVARAQRDGEVEATMHAQAELKRLKKRKRSHEEALPRIRATIDRLEAEGPGVPRSLARPT